MIYTFNSTTEEPNKPTTKEAAAAADADKMSVSSWTLNRNHNKRTADLSADFSCSFHIFEWAESVSVSTLTVRF